ncbi:VC0807 family protein [Streptomyces orinoci]|uniref:VC0807 family protein n=1 Tax=Streptomyces orinoci TaxID=67339 RepID=A0ABV3JX90_STRON|nr:VC0807 family protein [Streptomyces orinoci]
MTETLTTAHPPLSKREKQAAVRKLVVKQLLLELALPLGGFYGLQAAGVGQWLALLLGSLLAAPWLVHGMVKRRRVEAMPLFTLCLMVVGALMTLVTGSPRVLLIRDSWLFGMVGLWALGTLPTRRPFVMVIARPAVIAKAGEAGWRAFEARWDTEPGMRRRVRVLSAVWAVGLTGDAAIRVVLALTLPVGSVPLVSTLQYVVLLTGLIAFHKRYIARHGLEV